MTRGMDELAEREGLTPIMVTLTLPPEWHPAPAVGRRSWTIDRSPQATDDALRALWKLFGSRLAKGMIDPLGLRVWEPHRDGCPHAHALLYVRDDQIAEVDRHLRAVCPDTVPGRRVASDLTVVDRTRARGSTYLTSYLTNALYAGGGCEDSDRMRATAGERGWRRYGFLGVHGVQKVWQRVLTATDAEVAAAPARMREAHAALKAGRWADALEAMGARRRRGAGRLRLGYETETVDQETGEILPLVDRYGTPCRRAAWLTDTEVPAWRLPLGRGGTIERVSGTQKVKNFKGVGVSESFPRGLELAKAFQEAKIPRTPTTATTTNFVARCQQRGFSWRGQARRTLPS